MENSVQTQPVSLEETYNQAADLLIRQKLSPEQATETLVSNGILQQDATNVIVELQGQITAAKKKHAEKEMLYGGLWCVGGTVATLADVGFIFWGAILFGGIQFVRGLISYLSIK